MLTTMLFALFYVIAIPAAFISPLIVRILIFGVNCIIPDPIPYVDEILMGAGVISKMKTADPIFSHFTFFKWLLILAVIAFLAFEFLPVSLPF